MGFLLSLKKRPLIRNPELQADSDTAKILCFLLEKGEAGSNFTRSSGIILDYKQLNGFKVNFYGCFAEKKKS